MNLEPTMITNILTGILAITTGFYAWVTFKIMKANQQVVAAMKTQSEAETRPYVSISVFTVPNNPVFYLRIKNTGRTGASKLRLKLDRDFFQYGQKTRPNLKNVVAFQQVIDQLPPGSEIVFGLAQGFVVLGDGADEGITPPVFSITATYSYGATSVNETTTIDLRPYRDGMRAPSAEVEELKKIRQELEKLTAAVQSNVAAVGV